MPTTDIPLAQEKLIHVTVPENYSLALLHVGKSEIYLKISPDTPPTPPASEPAVINRQPAEIHPDVLAWCDKKGIAVDFQKALAIVREDFPDLRDETISLEDHEILEWVVVIEGIVADSPENIARRNWDCLGRWVQALSRDGFMYFHLCLNPEGA